MSYKTDLHCHNAEVSDCANAYSDLVAEKYIRQGYTTVVLTNHLSEKTFIKHPELNTWDKKITFFMSGVEALRKASCGKFNVLFAAEVRMRENRNDYLVYGITEEFLRRTPNILDISIKELSALCRENGFLLIQAHPFRDDMKIVKPTLLDGMEVYNAQSSRAPRNDIAFQWASRYNLIMTSGSDHHDPDDVLAAGIRTPFPITSMDMLIRVLKSRSYELIREAYTF